ncbi:Protein CBG17473, partial [Caenorhabditis briggsae]
TTAYGSPSHSHPSQTRKMSFKISKSDLQLKLNEKDSNVTFGESYRFAEIQKILIRNEENDEFIESGFVICTQCNLMISQSDGSHLKRHVITTCKKRNISIGRSELEPIEKVRKITDYSTKKLKDSEVQKITSALGRYCLKTGKSFHHLGSENMKKLLIEICNSINADFVILSANSWEHIIYRIAAHGDVISGRVCNLVSPVEPST